MSRPRGDRWLRWTTGTAALAAGGLVLLIIAFLALQAAPALRSSVLAGLFTDAHWRPGSARDPQFALAPMLVGSLAVTLLAVGLAAPLGILGAVWHCFYLPRHFQPLNQRLLELLAGVPSVVFGFWGLTVLVPALNRLHPPGQSLLAAGLVLALMILPTIALAGQSALAAVDPSQRLAAAGLGLSRYAIIRHIVLPAAAPGLGAGVVLAVTRALGETMAVVMVCGNVPELPRHLFDPVRPVPATIALEMGYAGSAHKAVLYAAALILVLATALIAGVLAFGKTRAIP